MFSSLPSGKGNSISSLHVGAPAQNEKSSKPLTQKERYEIAVAGARGFAESSNARIAAKMDQFNAVANDSRWFYGYGTASMVVSLGASLALGGRWPFFRSYCGMFALAGGYFGGKLCVGTHTAALMNHVVQQIDKEVSEANRLNEVHKDLLPDYKREAERLLKVKYELLPDLPEAAEMRNKKNRSIDDTVDDLVESYLSERAAMSK